MFTSTQRALKLDVVLFVERSGEFTYAARLRSQAPEPKGNRVLIARDKSVAIDPKPGDLAMSRMKWR